MRMEIDRLNLVAIGIVAMIIASIVGGIFV